MIPKLYTEPEYYDSAFGHRDFEREVSFLEAIFGIYSSKKVKSVLDVGCGTCPHSFELSKRGYKVAGIDNSEKMLQFVMEKAAKHNVKIKLHREDMRYFMLPENYDAAISMTNTFLCLLSEKEYHTHLGSVANVLEKNGLYIIDFDNPDYWYKDIEKEPLISEYELENENKTVQVKSLCSPLDAKNNIYEFRFILSIEKDGAKDVFESQHTERLIFSKEFKSLIREDANFEFLNYYGDFSLGQFDAETSLKMIAILRKR